MKKTSNILRILFFLILVTFILTGGVAALWLCAALLALGAGRIIWAIADSGRALYRNRADTPSRESMVKIVAMFMGLFLITGTLIFLYAFHSISIDKDHQFSNIEYLLRSFIYSIDLFMLDVDGNLFDNLSAHPIVKGLVVSQAMLSFACTISLLLSLAFSRAKAYYKLHRRTRITADKNHLYLFFGLNEPTRLLAREAYENDPRAVIIIIDKANIDDDDSDSWGSIVSMFTHRRKTFAIADESHALVAVTYRRLSDLDKTKDGDDITGSLGVAKIRGLVESLQAYKDSRLHIFFLSDNEEENILGLSTLARDKTILATAACDNVSQRIYCHARYNGPNRVVEDLAVSKGLDVTIIDSSHLAVEILKSDVKNQPVNVVRLSDKVPTAVASQLDCLIVGFGEVGRDAFRFLYEFGAFIDERSPEGHGDRSPFTCTAIDREMDVLEGAFSMLAPAIPVGHGKALEMLTLDYNNSEFYGKVMTPQRATTINYIVIAMPDDDANIALAGQLFTYIRRFRDDFSNLIIMVRCNRDEKVDMMQKVADHYNHGYGNGDENVPVIRLFGRPKEIYTYRSIINEQLINDGKKFFENYQTVSRPEKERETWDGRRDDNLGKKDDCPRRPPQLDKLRRLRRQESQDFANALHAGTKLHLLKAAFGPDYDWDAFVNRFFTGKEKRSTITGSHDTLTYPGIGPMENEVMLRLAMLEHLRWNASHEILGYTVNNDTNRCEERLRTHNCLRPWHELDDQSRAASGPGWVTDYKRYDFGVVETTISLAADRLIEDEV